MLKRLKLWLKKIFHKHLKPVKHPTNIELVADGYTIAPDYLCLKINNTREIKSK